MLSGLVVGLLGLCRADAATLHVGPDERHRTLAQAFSAMRSGDTLIIRDGVYTGPDNQIRADNRPPSGTAGGFTLVRAEHPGQAVFDGALALTMLDFRGTTTMAYVELRGLQFVRPNPAVPHTITGRSWTEHSAHHLKVRECGFQHAFHVNHVSYALVEDCYVTGAGRYNFMAFGSDHVTFRRCIARLDAADGGGMPISHFINYDSTDVEFQNCIAVDSDDIHYRNYEGTYGGFFVRGPFDGTGGVMYYSANTRIAGSLALNVHHAARGVGGMTLPSQAAGTVVEQTVFWDQARVFQFAKSGPVADDFAVRHSTFGQITADDASSLRNAVAGFVSATGVTGDVSDSIFTRITNRGTGIAAAIRDTRVSLNNAFFGNEADVAGVAVVTNSLFGIDPLAQSLKYLVRIEPDSPLARAGTDGSTVGATLLNRFGADGTMHGDPGHFALTSESLWPWPQESIVQAFFRVYGQPAPDPRRGFCAEGQTLTNYVWGYLGHTVPPLGLTATPGDGSITLTWQPPAPVARRTLAGYRVYRLEAGKPQLVKTVEGAGSSAVTIEGAPAGVEVILVMTALDSQKGESGYSPAVRAVPGVAPHVQPASR